MLITRFRRTLIGIAILALVILSLGTGQPLAEAKCTEQWVPRAKGSASVESNYKLVHGVLFVLETVCSDGKKPGGPARDKRREESERLNACIAAARNKAARGDGGIVEFLCHMRYGGAKPDPATPDFAALARSLAVYLRLPDTNPRFGPDPDHNEWHMLAVGYPVWLWTDGPTRRTATATAGTLTFHLTATRTGTTFDLGDGHTLHCTKTTPYPTSVKPGSPSPTCGHVYTKASTPGRYTVTATAHWQVAWSVDGFTGTFPMSYTDTSTLAIGELQALVR